jgi:hypothetical protein
MDCIVRKAVIGAVSSIRHEVLTRDSGSIHRISPHESRPGTRSNTSAILRQPHIYRARSTHLSDVIGTSTHF